LKTLDVKRSVLKSAVTGVVLGWVLLPNFTLAQPDAPPAHGGKPPRIAQMEDKLGLTDEQVQKMREIRDNGGSMADMRAVLTPEQQVKAAQLRKEHKGDLDERKAQMQQALGLSDEQMAKMAQVRKDGGSREDMRAVLTPQQQAKFDAMRSQHGPKAPAPPEGTDE
jgi:Spy/CpxP family protein refolding chaperone